MSNNGVVGVEGGGGRGVFVQKEGEGSGEWTNA